MTMDQNACRTNTMDEPNSYRCGSYYGGLPEAFRIFPTVFVLTVLFCAAIFIISCGKDHEDELLIFAAASVIDVLLDTEKEFVGAWFVISQPGVH